MIVLITTELVMYLIISTKMCDLDFHNPASTGLFLPVILSRMVLYWIPRYSLPYKVDDFYSSGYYTNS